MIRLMIALTLVGIVLPTSASHAEHGVNARKSGLFARQHRSGNHVGTVGYSVRSSRVSLHRHRPARDVDVRQGVGWTTRPRLDYPCMSGTYLLDTYAGALSTYDRSGSSCTTVVQR